MVMHTNDQMTGFTIVLVCIGQYQKYLPECVRQLHVWENKNIVILTDTKSLYDVLVDAFKMYDSSDVRIELIHPEDCGGLHEYFEQHSQLSHDFRNGFLRHCFKRFVYIYGYLKKTGTQNIVHMENDVMTYCHFNSTLEGYFDSDIHLIVDSDHRCIPSIMFFRDYVLLEICLRNHNEWNSHENDMYFWARIRNYYPDNIKTIPIALPCEQLPKYVWEHFKKDIGIFDGAGIGQYIGGVDPENTNNHTVGFINETCIVKYDRYKFFWTLDEMMGVWKPVLYDYYGTGDMIPILNLHIHSKALRAFASVQFDSNQLESRLCPVVKPRPKHECRFQDVKCVDHFVTFSDHAISDLPDVTWRKIKRPFLNKPVIYVRGSEFQHLLETHHVFLRRPFVIISCLDILLHHIDDRALAGFLDRGHCHGILVGSSSSEDKRVHPKIFRDIESFNKTINKLKEIYPQ
jgi:hypothetical protein